MFLFLNDEKNNINTIINNDEEVFQTFNFIYPFTTENVAGYMQDLNLTNKKIITVAGSGDHVINSISRGATDITAFDVNPLTKYYLDLKIAAIKNLSYPDYMYTFLYRGNNLNSSQINNLDMPNDSKKFWLRKLSLNGDDWLKLRRSSLFNPGLIDPRLISQCNLYFDEYVYEKIKNTLDNVNITFLLTNLKDLTLTQQYDYMFLSNIFDYVDLMYVSNPIENYSYLIQSFLENCQKIYFAYLYDVNGDTRNGYEKNVAIFKSIFGDYETKIFETSIFVDEKNKIKDAALVLTRK